MKRNLSGNISQWQNDLAKNGYTIVELQLPDQLISFVRDEKYKEIDDLVQDLTSKHGDLYKFFNDFVDLKYIEFIISLRESKNDWEEDGIWHDDGSRALAFSLSLSPEPPKNGGVLEIRKKGETQSIKIPTPPYGTAIIFQTGRHFYEHKINAVTEGKRLIIAGWCYDSKSDSFL